MPGLTQRTLTGEPAETDRKPPGTMLLCEECGEHVLRSRKWDHEHDLTGADTPTEAQAKRLEDKIPDHALFDTKTYRVEYRMEFVEVVTVEARSKSDAEREAEHHRTYKGDYKMDVHTEKRAVGDASQASIEYLENNGLLPDDHDVTAEDIDRLLEVRT